MNQQATQSSAPKKSSGSGAIMFAVKAFVAFIIMRSILGFLLLPILLVLLASVQNVWLPEVVIALITFIALYLALFFILKNSKDEKATNAKGALYTIILAALWVLWRLSEQSTESVVGVILGLIAVYLAFQLTRKYTK